MPDYSNTRLQFRKGTFAEWAAANPVLASGEPGYDITNKILKVGDGTTQFASLSGITGGGGSGGGGSTQFTGLLDTPANFTSSAGLVVKVNSAASSLEFGGIDIVTDTSPQLGGNLDLNSKNITGTGDIDLQGTIDANGSIQGSSIKRIGGTSSQFLKADGSVDSNAYITSLEDDGTPVLGGSLTLDQHDINIQVKNDSGSSITAGTPVYIAAYHAGSSKPLIAPANASSTSTMPAFGIVENTIADGAEGLVAIMGIVAGIDTTSPISFSANDIVYVKAGGGLTNVKPTGVSEQIQNLGKVTKVHNSNGRILLLGAGRSNDIPNSGTFNGNVQAASFIKSGGTSSEFLKADGSVDTSTYATSSDISNSSNWNTAYGWGDHGVAGYLTSVSNIDTTNFNATAIVTAAETIGSNDNDTTLPTSAAVKEYVTSALGGGSLNNMTEDSTPQLGGDLDLNGFEINGSGITRPILRQDGNDVILNSTGGELFLRGGDADLSYQVEIATTYAKFADNRFQILASETVLNQSGASVDFRVEGDNNANLLFADASADKVGIGTSTPSTLLHVAGSITATSFAALSGVSSQFLKADGSFDTSTYLTSYTETDTLANVTSRGNTTTTTCVIPFLYANQAAFPAASGSHGAIAHSHSDGAMYFAHGGSWNKLANQSAVDSAGYLTAETNDLSAAVTWTNVPSGNITQGSVTQHQAALSITESQISDLQSYLTSETFTSVVQDTTPQLGGALDAQSNNITSVGNLGVGGGATFEKNLIVNNAGSATSSDFQVKGDSDTHLLFTDAANDKVGIGTSTPQHKLDVVGMGRFVHADGSCGLQVEDTGGSGLHIGDCALGSVNTYAGMKHSNHGDTEYMMVSNGVTTFLSAVNNGAVIIRGGGNDSANEIQIKDVGAGVAGIIFNEGGADRDIRMEGDTEENLFYVDASTNRIGVGTATPDQTFDVSTVQSEIAGFNGQASSDPVGSGNLQSLIIETKNGAGAKGVYLKHMCNESNGSSTLSMKNVLRMGEGIISFDDAYTTGLSTTYYPKLQVNTDTGAVTFNNTYTFPTADGSANQVLQTDGAGNISFGNLSTLNTTSFASSAIVTNSDSIASNANDTSIPTSSAVKAYADTKMASDTTAVANSVAVNNVVMITQTNYDALGSYDANTVYFITS